MHIREGVPPSLLFGSLAVVLPALVWVFVFWRGLRDPRVFYGHGILIWLFVTPAALVAAAACAGPATALAAGGFDDVGGMVWWPRWRVAVIALSVLGLVLALGTFIGPAMVADALR